MKDLIKLANKPPSKKWKTFDKWSSKGKMINKGEKATFYGGKAYFHKRQVSNPRENFNDVIYRGNNHDWDEYPDWGWGDMKGY